MQDRLDSIHVNASASKLQAAFRGFKQRRLFAGIARKLKARASFAQEHELLTKRLEQKLHINEALKRAATENIDPSREAMHNAAISIQKAWKRSNLPFDPALIKREQLHLKMACRIQRAFRKWRTAITVKEKPTESSNEFGVAAFEYLKTPPSIESFTSTSLPPPEDHTLAERLIARSRQLRARLEDPSTIFGTASRSLLPRARDEVAQLLKSRKFQVESDFVSSKDKDLILRYELAN